MKKIVTLFCTVGLLLCSSACFADVTNTSTQATLKLRDGILSFDNITPKPTATNTQTTPVQTVQKSENSVPQKTTSVGQMLNQHPEKIIVAAPDKQKNDGN